MPGLIITPGRHHKDGNGEYRHMRGMRPSRPEMPGTRKMMLPPPGAVFPRSLFLAEADLVVLRDQGQLGCCVGASYAEVADQHLARQNKLTPDNETSMLDAYDVARIAGGTPLDEDSGSTSADMCDGARVYGVSTEKLRPFSDDESVWSKDRAPEVVADALTRRDTLDFALPTIASMKHALMQGFAFIFGFTCYESLMSPETASTGKILMPEPGEQIVGGHELSCFGWDDDIVVGDCVGAFIPRNHWDEWGAKYGQIKGYGVLPYAMFNQGIASEARCPRIIGAGAA